MVGVATLHQQIAMLEAVGPVVEFLGVPNIEVDTGTHMQTSTNIGDLTFLNFFFCWPYFQF